MVSSASKNKTVGSWGWNTLPFEMQHQILHEVFNLIVSGDLPFASPTFTVRDDNIDDHPKTSANHDTEEEDDDDGIEFHDDRDWSWNENVVELSEHETKPTVGSPSARTGVVQNSTPVTRDMAMNLVYNLPSKDVTDAYSHLGESLRRVVTKLPTGFFLEDFAHHVGLAKKLLQEYRSRIEEADFAILDWWADMSAAIADYGGIRGPLSDHLTKLATRLRN